NLQPASGSLGGSISPPVPPPTPPPPPASLVSGLVASPSVLTLNADGTGLAVSVGFTLAAQAQVTAKVGTLQLLNGSLPAGAQQESWDLSQLPDGRYTLTLT